MLLLWLLLWLLCKRRCLLEHLLGWLVRRLDSDGQHRPLQLLMLLLLLRLHGTRGKRHGGWHGSRGANIQRAILTEPATRRHVP